MNDKKGHNFMNDINEMSRSNFLLVDRELLLGLEEILIK